jgi:hypothetical protein
MALLANTLVLATLLYVVLTPADLTPARFTLYGLLWVGVGLAVLYREATVARSASIRARRAATGVAVAYLTALAFAGVVIPGGVPEAVANGWFVRTLPPGWGPALVYGGVDIAVVLTPARVVGYLALAALVRGTVLDAAGTGALRSGAPGLLALFSCVSCSLPLLAGAAAFLFGAGSALAATTASLSYDLSTLIFLVTVGLLYWRPLARR